MSEPRGQVWTVSELAASIKNQLEQTFPDVFVRGEVTALSKPASGHVYFTLKDDKASIRCVLYRHIQRYMRAVPEANQEVLVRGKLSAYGPRSEYQIVVDYLEPVGLGTMYAAFLQLQKKLADKGYFALERKRRPPFLPHIIGIVTSLSGAALHDMLRIIYNRRPNQHVVVAPTLVQGDTAPAAIARAIAELNETAHPDLLIVGRGGGSPEDLWAWNEEAVVEAVVNSPVPVISGVGHEVDVTLCDLAADVRAATPTHAAELAVPKTTDLLTTLQNNQRRAGRAVVNLVAGRRDRHLDLNRRLLREGVPTATLSRELDELQDTMIRAAQSMVRDHEHRVFALTQQLRSLAPKTRLADQRARLTVLRDRLEHKFRTLLRERQQQLDRSGAALTALSPLAVLSRGYAIVTNESGVAMRNASETKVDERVGVRLHRGRLQARIEEIESD